MEAPTLQGQYRAPIFASVLLVLALLQGSTFVLSIAYAGPLASSAFVSATTLLWVAMYCAAMLGLLATSGVNWISWIVRYRLLLTLLLAGAAFSVAWSVDTALTIERSIHLIGTSILAIYLGLKLPLSHILKTTVWVFGFIMLSSILAAVFIPDLGLQEYQGRLVWSGSLASKNTLGFWAAMSLLLSISLCFWHLPTEQRIGFVLIAIMSVACLHFSVSATSVLALIIASLVMLYFYAAFSLRLSLVAMLILAIFVSAFGLMAFMLIDTAELIGRSDDLTGRGEVWSQTWRLITERPLTGYGYGTIWFPTEESLWIQQSLTDLSWTVFHAHNGLLQIASEIGLPLTIIAILMIVQQLIEIIYCQYQRQQPGALFVLGFMTALLVSNYSEARLLMNRELFWIFFIALPISMLQQVNVTAAHPTDIKGGVRNQRTDKLRESLERKIEKHTIKGRVKKLSALRLINAEATKGTIQKKRT